MTCPISLLQKMASLVSHGVVAIISVEKFDDMQLPSRPGAQKDYDNLLHLYRDKLKFDVHPTQLNLTAGEILATMNEREYHVNVTLLRNHQRHKTTNFDLDATYSKWNGT